MLFTFLNQLRNKRENSNSNLVVGITKHPVQFDFTTY